MSERIGVMLNNLERDRIKAFAVAASHGFELVHTSALPERWLRGPERQEYVRAARASGVTIASMFVGFDGQSYADIPTIRRTVGLVIAELRERRRDVAKRYSELAKELNVLSLSAHIGFIPEPGPDYDALVACVRDIVDHYARQGQTLNLETGQDSAEVLRQFIQDVARPNVGVNFDPANFLLYGSDEPLAALDVLGPLIRGVHCKDARRSQVPGVLGTEVPLGEGEVDFPAFLGRLKALGYEGPLVIEHEGGSPRALDEILAGRDYLRRLLQRC